MRGKFSRLLPLVLFVLAFCCPVLMASAAYSIDVLPAANGTVSVSPREASPGQTVTVMLLPDEHYQADSLMITSEGKVLAANGIGQDSYTFTMPAGRVEIRAGFAQTESPQFNDVPDSAFYAEAVKWAVEQGITQGTTLETFSPYSDCTRAQTVTFLWRAEGSPAPMGRPARFRDVPEDAYYVDAVTWAVEQGITMGTGDGSTFSPDDTVSRAQAVTFLWRAAGSQEPRGGTERFADVPDSAYYARAVSWAVAEGVTRGTGNGSIFSPDDDCLRGQIVTFLYRLYGN